MGASLPSDQAGVVCCAGPRASLHWLLRELDSLLDAAASDPALLSQPIRVIVPSRSLRVHLARRVVERRGAAVGLVFQTLETAVEEILSSQSLGSPPADGQALFAWLTKRVAEREEGGDSARSLARHLARYEDGYGSLVESVADLIDAGFGAGQLEAVSEHIEASTTGAVRDVALAVARIAAALRESYADLGLSYRADRFERALAYLERDDSCFPQRAVFLYGFADATGTQASFLEGLVRYVGARAGVDVPAADNPVVGGAAFPERLLLRLSAARGIERLHRDEDPSAGNEHYLRVASDCDAEAREVAEAAARLIESGVLPEEIALVSRDLAPYAAALARSLGERGVPFSGAPGARTFPGHERRRFLAVVELQRQGARARFDTWLAARAVSSAGVRELRPWGAIRLLHLTETPPRLRLEASREEWQHARAFASRAGSSPAEQSVEDHRRQLLACLGTAEADFEAEVGGALDALTRLVPEALRLRREDLAELLDAATSEHGMVPLGGAGGGVQVLSVTEARGLSWRHLFVLGMNRDLFPRTIREDPLFPDDLRSKLCQLLPEFPVKARGFDEERYLAAQLATSAETVHWSYSLRDSLGIEAPPSPLLEGIRTLAKAGAPTPAPADNERDRAALEVSLAMAAREVGGTEEFASELADSRVSRGGEWDAPTSEDVSALGRVEPPSVDAAPTYVTSLERLLTCPWRYFLERVLAFEGREPPVGELPRLSPRLVGDCVHRVLQRIGESRGVPSRELLSGLAEEEDFTWPDEEELEGHLREVSEACAESAGIGLPGFSRALMERTRAHVLRVRALDPPGLAWLGVEIEGSVDNDALPDGALRFRVDRVEAKGGERVLTDYKTGRQVGDYALQSAAYAAAEGSDGGRYLFTRPDLKDSKSHRGIRSVDREARRRLDEAVAAAMELWNDGNFFPRLCDDKGQDAGACRFCPVAEACRRGGSPIREALLDLAEGSSPARQRDPSHDVFRRAFGVDSP